ncbi:hypothetical protein SDSE159_14950 [Streptococcus dysgalactiae subsp. equisimilis]|nr:hypothetical protein SDSE159_14950 [Streptococcus dysgalactiae subsp. equisimilis]
MYNYCITNCNTSQTKKIVFPNEEALEHYLVTLFNDYNFKQEQRVHKGFGHCTDTLESLFD